jgi:hypothetical protein
MMITTGHPPVSNRVNVFSENYDPETCGMYLPEKKPVNNMIICGSDMKRRSSPDDRKIFSGKNDFRLLRISCFSGAKSTRSPEMKETIDDYAADRSPSVCGF